MRACVCVCLCARALVCVCVCVCARARECCVLAHRVFVLQKDLRLIIPTHYYFLSFVAEMKRTDKQTKIGRCKFGSDANYHRLSGSALFAIL